MTARAAPDSEPGTVRSAVVSRRRLLRGGLLLGAGVAGVTAAVAGCRSPSAGSSSGSPSPHPPPSTAAGADGGAAAPVRPAALLRTSWSTDPWAGGSYSYLPVGAAPQARAALAAPVAGRVVFAGEATSSRSPATVDGALESGRRAAGEIIAAAGVRRERIAVVGAGVAGLAAASSLLAAGHQVQVWEARDRIGGRVDTVRPNGWPIPVELGASWAHAARATGLDAELARAGVTTVPFAYRTALLAARGRTEAAGTLLEPAAAALERAIEWAQDRDADLSIADALRLSGSAAGVDPDVLALYLASEVGTEYAASARQLSAWWGTEEGLEGDDLLVVGGYGRLAESLAAGVDVRLRRAVRQIAWSADDVEVRVSTGEAWDVDRVVVTVPLGVLKDGSLRFVPGLPAAKRQAVETLGMGLLDKVWVRFDRPFWRSRAEVWATTEPAVPGFSTWYNLEPATGAPVLMALLGADDARRWAEASDHEVEAAVVASLQQFASVGW